MVSVVFPHQVFGTVLPIGLNRELEWPACDESDASARLFCHIHMWRQCLRHITPLLSKGAEKEEWQRQRVAFKKDCLILQRAPSQRHFSILAKLMGKKWEALNPSVWEYFRHNWLESRACWGQRTCADVICDSKCRHSNSVEGINKSLKQSGNYLAVVFSGA